MKLFEALIAVLLGPTALGSTENNGLFSLRRGLQSIFRLWDISEPGISYSGFQLDLDYTVRDHVRTNYVSVQLFESEDCERFEIFPNNNYVDIDIINDLSSFGDGVGTRTVRCLVGLNFCYTKNRIRFVWVVTEFVCEKH